MINASKNIWNNDEHHITLTTKIKFAWQLRGGPNFIELYSMVSEEKYAEGRTIPPHYAFTLWTSF
jgi:hypothetical protein